MQAPGGHELVGDYWELVCGSPAGGVEGVVNESSSVDAQLDQRHLMLRGDTVGSLGACDALPLSCDHVLMSCDPHSSPRCSDFAPL